MISPHFKIPFRFTDTDAELVEQESDAEVFDNIEMVLRTRRGERIDLPEFGTLELNFQEGGVNIEALRQDIEHGEPRARELIDRDPDSINQLIDNINISPGGPNG